MCVLYLVGGSVAVRAAEAEVLRDRIYAGDYRWTRDFPRKEAELVGYGYALFAQIVEVCPRIITRSQQDQVAALIHGLSDSAGDPDGFPDLVALNRAFLGSVFYKPAARAHVKSIVGTPPCAAEYVQRLGQNLWRMLAKRRPLYSDGSAGRVTFLREAIVPLGFQHYYLDQVPSVAHGVPHRIFEADVQQVRSLGLGLTILECSFDENSDDQQYEKQYYWGPSRALGLPFLGQWFKELLITTRQARMDEATGSGGMGRGRVIHPFATYGSPRRECPAAADPGLPVNNRFAQAPEGGVWDTRLCKPIGGVFECPD